MTDEPDWTKFGPGHVPNPRTYPERYAEMPRVESADHDNGVVTYRVPGCTCVGVEPDNRPSEDSRCPVHARCPNCERMACNESAAVAEAIRARSNEQQARQELEALRDARSSSTVAECIGCIEEPREGVSRRALVLSGCPVHDNESCWHCGVQLLPRPLPHCDSCGVECSEPDCPDCALPSDDETVGRR